MDPNYKNATTCALFRDFYLIFGEIHHRYELLGGDLNAARPAAAEVAPISSLPPGKMDRAIIIDVISCQIDAYTENRGKYNIQDFRKHCEPLLTKCFHQEDLDPSDSGAPKWIDRFGYAHRKIAERRGYIHQANGVYVKLST